MAGVFVTQPKIKSQFTGDPPVVLNVTGVIAAPEHGVGVRQNSVVVGRPAHQVVGENKTRSGAVIRIAGRGTIEIELTGGLLVAKLVVAQAANLASYLDRVFALL